MVFSERVISSISQYSTLEYPNTEYTLIGMKKSIHTDERALFIKRLKQARIEAGLTQIDVAAKLECSQSWVSKIELGELRVEAIWLNRLAKLYGKNGWVKR
jgi:DNA-binding XRE family transcriptional regulator